MNSIGFDALFTPSKFSIKEEAMISHAIWKPRVVPLNILYPRLIELNNYLPVCPGLDQTKNMYEAKINKIPLRAVPNGWGNQSYLEWWDFDKKPTKRPATCSRVLQVI